MESISGDKTGSDDESDLDVIEDQDVPFKHDPDWSCEVDGFESSVSESDDENDESEKRSRNHIRYGTCFHNIFW